MILKRFVCLLVLSVITLLPLRASTANVDETMQKFWDEFSAAVRKKDVEAIARLSNFPITMSYGIPSVKNKIQLRKHYRTVFNEQSDAAACFSKKQPELDEGNPKRFTVACPDQAGNEVVVYQFSRTKAGWKFVGLDNLNE
jgi:hypothetical protein